MKHHITDRWWCDTGSDADSGENDAVGDAAFLGRNPPRDKLIGCRIDNGFTRAQEESNRNEKEQRCSHLRWHDGGQGGENSPPDGAGSEHAPGTKLVAEPASGGLKERVP